MHVAIVFVSFSCVCVCVCGSDCESEKEMVNGSLRSVIYKRGMPHRSKLCESFMRLLEKRGRKHGCTVGTDPIKGKPLHAQEETRGEVHERGAAHRTGKEKPCMGHVHTHASAPAVSVAAVVDVCVCVPGAAVAGACPVYACLCVER